MPLVKLAVLLMSQPLFQQRHKTLGRSVNLIIFVPKLFWEYDTELNYDRLRIVSSQKQQGPFFQS